MSALVSSTTSGSNQPIGYETPSFPSLYWPFPLYGDQSYFLYNVSDIWRFTLYWTLIFYGALHLTTSGYAVLIQWRNWRVIWIAPLAFIIVGGFEALISGSIVGALLGVIYNAGSFEMSTWIPFVWALADSLILILSSFAIQGAL